MNSPVFDPDLHHDDTSSTQSRKRKAAASSASGRGVASLTPEQLAKKRANDREAQRAIRERTKNTIESLEREIHQLKTQQPYQELQTIIEQKNAVEAENADIRRRLASVVNILQPFLGTQGLTDLAQAAQQNVQALEQPPAIFHSEQYMSGDPARTLSSQPDIASQSLADQHNYPSPFPPTESDVNEDLPLWQNQRAAFNNQRETMHRSHELSENGERLNFNFLVDATLPSKHTFASSLPERRSPPSDPSLYTSFPHAQTSTPVWAMQPKNCSPTCQLDYILRDFLDKRRKEELQQTGTGQKPAYTSPAYPSISNLLNPTNATTTAADPSPSTSHRNLFQAPKTSQPSHHPPAAHFVDPLSDLMVKIIRQFKNISALPDQVATIFMLFIYMRWQIYSTQENYERLPDWLTPRPSQFITPHPAWVDHLIWPRMRDKIIENYHLYDFENWFAPFTRGLSVNWPYAPSTCLIYLSENVNGGESREPLLNPAFEEHIRKLENWSVDSNFIHAFPALRGTVNVKDQPDSTISAFSTSQMPQGLMDVGGTGIPIPMPMSTHQSNGQAYPDQRQAGAGQSIAYG